MAWRIKLKKTIKIDKKKIRGSKERQPSNAIDRRSDKQTMEHAWKELFEKNGRAVEERL